MPNVVFGHAFSREALLKPRAHAGAINLIEFRNSLYGFGFTLNDEAGCAILDHLRNRAGCKCDDRRAAGHGFDHHQAKRLRPLNRKQQSRRASQKVLLGLFIDLPDEFNPIAIDHWLYFFAEVPVLRSRDLRRNPQWHPCGLGDPDRSFRAFVWSDPAKKGQIASSGIRRSECIDRQSMINRAQPAGFGQGTPLVIRDRDERCVWRMPRILLKLAKQALLLIMLCGVGLRFNLVRDELLGGVSDERSPEDRESACRLSSGGSL